MTEPDPLSVLRTPPTESVPDPAWAAGLRARLQAEMTRNEESPMDSIIAEQRPTITSATITAYLAVADARAAIAWYSTVFGAVSTTEAVVMPDGRIGHAELSIGGARIYLSDAHPEIGIVAPTPGASAVTLHLELDDVAAVVEAARHAGATIDREPVAQPYGTQAVLTDPSGHRWMVMSPAPDPTSAPMRDGDVAYASLWVTDVARAARFYSAVLGWDCERVVAGQTCRVHGLSIDQGISESSHQTNVFCAYGVHDLEAARTRVADAGGRVGEIDDAPWGLLAECIDPDGIEFAIWQIEPGTTRPPINGRRNGDLGYLTLSVTDPDRSRAFYGAALGWSFTPEGNPDDTAPMTGISQTHDRLGNVPLWLTDDIDAAVERVREAGGTATEPEQRPYGRMSTCRDDQGIDFYLGEL